MVVLLQFNIKIVSKIQTQWTALPHYLPGSYQWCNIIYYQVFSYRGTKDAQEHKAAGDSQGSFLPPVLHSTLLVQTRLRDSISTDKSFSPYLKPHTKAYKIREILKLKKKHKKRLHKLLLFLGKNVIPPTTLKSIISKSFTRIHILCLCHAQLYIQDIFIKRLFLKSSLLKGFILTSLQSSFVQLVLMRVSNHLTVPSSPQERKV